MCETAERIETGLAGDRAKIRELKESLSEVFGGMGSFMLSTSRKMDTFRGIIRPYVDYFYPPKGTESRETFIREVVEPSRDEMDEAIDRAVEIMAEDEAINRRVSEAINHTLDLRRSFDELLGMIEAIEIYAVNTMLVSTKAGAMGDTLTKISGEMSALSEKAGGIAMEFGNLISDMEDAYKSFMNIREKIDIINENYLTQMKIKNRMIFGEMMTELENLSTNVHEIMGYFGDVEGSIKGIMGWLQNEDIMRQDLEKIIFALEEMEGESSVVISPLEDRYGRDVLNGCLSLVADRKIETVLQDFRSLAADTEGCSDIIKNILNSFLSRFYGSRTEGKAYYEGQRFAQVYEKIEDMKDEYVGNIEDIINGKSNLYSIAGRIMDIMKSFSGFFGEISHIARRFEIINMLTKIELARHDELKRSLGGALGDVANLPSMMKKIIEKAQEMYITINESVEAAIGDYKVNYDKQEKTLRACITTMKKVSVKLGESQKYYKDISEEIGGTCTSMLSYIEGETRSSMTLWDMQSLLADISRKLRALSGQVAGEKDLGNVTIASIRNDLRIQGESLNYKKSALYTLFSDYEGRDVGDGVYLF